MNAIVEASPQNQKQRRTRSPGYPSISLQAALDLAKQVWVHEKRNSVPMTALAADWEANVKSSSFLLAISALKKFGLLEEQEKGKERYLKLTTDALNIILNEQEDSPDRIAILKRCALAPRIHAQLWTQFNGELPSDGNLRQQLIVDMDFNATAVDPFIKDFRDTIAFARLSHSDKIIVSESEGEALEENRPEKPLFRQKHVQEGLKSSFAPGTVLGNFINPPVSVLREFNFPLPTGVATLKVPFPLTEEDFDTLLKTLRTFKDGLVKKPDPVLLDCTDGWEDRAKALAELGIEFNLTNFDYTFEISKAKEVAAANNLNLRLDLNNKTALFRKRQAGTA